jgi:hypothetical protein
MVEPLGAHARSFMAGHPHGPRSSRARLHAFLLVPRCKNFVDLAAVADGDKEDKAACAEFASGTGVVRVEVRRIPPYGTKS